MSDSSSGTPPPDQPGDKPKRRPRYKGKHPRSFKDKYKEHDPSKYKETVEKIIAKGGTPAGTHRPIMVDEILEFLAPQAGQIFVDATLGFGGHSGEILKRLQPNGLLYSFDRDPIELPKTEARLRAMDQIGAETLEVIPSNYSEVEKELSKRNALGRIDGLLADLGLSSMQIDDPERGFTFKHEGPLDLRMNPASGEPAWKVLETISETELTRWLEEYSDEPRAKWCAKAILDARAKSPIRTTTEFANAIRVWLKTLSPRVREAEGDTPIRRAFQTLRIHVNDEFRSLDLLLQSLPRIMKPGGRIAILSFHSGEDRRVKKAFQAFERDGILKWVSPDISRPSFEEQKSNSRSKSAKLRCAIRA